jgi:hypothetical protein
MDKSSLEFKKADASTIKFNFELPNGLPYKKTLFPNFKLVQSTTTKEFGIYIKFEKGDIENISQDNIKVINYKLFENNELWLILNNYYVVLRNLSYQIINEINNNNLVFCFFDENESFLNGFRFE